MTDSAEREAFASSSCLVADDHPAVLRAVCEYLEEEGFEIAARAVREVLDGTSTATTQAGQEPGAVPEKR